MEEQEVQEAVQQDRNTMLISIGDNTYWEVTGPDEPEPTGDQDFKIHPAVAGLDNSAR